MVLALPRKEKARNSSQAKDCLCQDPEVGLSSSQVSQRISSGWVNSSVEPPTKTTGQIITSNLFTYFNLVFFLLAACVIAGQLEKSDVYARGSCQHFYRHSAGTALKKDP